MSTDSLVERPTAEVGVPFKDDLGDSDTGALDDMVDDLAVLDRLGDLDELVALVPVEPDDSLAVGLDVEVAERIPRAVGQLATDLRVGQALIVGEEDAVDRRPFGDLELDDHALTGHRAIDRDASEPSRLQQPPLVVFGDVFVIPVAHARLDVVQHGLVGHVLVADHADVDDNVLVHADIIGRGGAAGHGEQHDKGCQEGLHVF